MAYFEKHKPQHPHHVKVSPRGPESAEIPHSEDIIGQSTICQSSSPPRFATHVTLSALEDDGINGAKLNEPRSQKSERPAELFQWEKYADYIRTFSRPKEGNFGSSCFLSDWIINFSVRGTPTAWQEIEAKGTKKQLNRMSMIS